MPRESTLDNISKRPATKICLFPGKSTIETSAVSVQPVNLSSGAVNLLKLNNQYAQIEPTEFQKPNTSDHVKTQETEKEYYFTISHNNYENLSKAKKVFERGTDAAFLIPRAISDYYNFKTSEKLPDYKIVPIYRCMSNILDIWFHYCFKKLASNSLKHLENSNNISPSFRDVFRERNNEAKEIHSQKLQIKSYSFMARSLGVVTFFLAIFLSWWLALLCGAISIGLKIFALIKDQSLEKENSKLNERYSLAEDIRDYGHKKVLAALYEENTKSISNKVKSRDLLELENKLKIKLSPEEFCNISTNIQGRIETLKSKISIESTISYQQIKDLAYNFSYSEEYPLKDAKKSKKSIMESYLTNIGYLVDDIKSLAKYDPSNPDIHSSYMNRVEDLKDLGCPDPEMIINQIRALNYLNNEQSRISKRNEIISYLLCSAQYVGYKRRE